jgi:ABC-type multidrug transport system permease subunit
VLRAIADVLPLKYLIQLVNAAYLGHHAFWTRPTAVGILAAWGIAGLVTAARRFRWEPRER